jgi:hypothetical protein
MRLFKKQKDKKAIICRNIPFVGMFLVFLWICFIIPQTIKSQSAVIRADSIKVKKHNPKLATLMSIVIPGTGQAYNKKYWKIPIIYVGLGSLGYMEYRNNTRYKNFKNAYSELLKTNADSTITIYGVAFTLNGLNAGQNYYRRYRDMFAIFTAGFYLLNIVDANVDAHLFDFDISDDISLRITPSAEESWAGPVTGLRIRINF